MNNIPIRFSTENRYWALTAGANIADVIVEEDTSADYEVHARHLYRLEDGRFAVVSEHGCSCYSMSDASIETFDTEKAAQVAYDAL